MRQPHVQRGVGRRARPALACSARTTRRATAAPRRRRAELAGAGRRRHRRHAGSGVRPAHARPRPASSAAPSPSATASSTTTGSRRRPRPRRATASGRCSTPSRARRATSRTAGGAARRRRRSRARLLPPERRRRRRRRSYPTASSAASSRTGRSAACRPRATVSSRGRETRAPTPTAPYSLGAPDLLVARRHGEPRRVIVSPRVAPAMMGVGLLENVPAAHRRPGRPRRRRRRRHLGATARARRRHGGEPVLGRFGWKADVPTVEHQNAAPSPATSASPRRCTPISRAARPQPSAWRAERRRPRARRPEARPGHLLHPHPGGPGPARRRVARDERRASSCSARSAARRATRPS